MVARFHRRLAVVAGVNELVLALIVQLIQHGQRGELRSPQRRELKVLVAGKGEEGIAAVHQIAGEQWIGILDGLLMELTICLN